MSTQYYRFSIEAREMPIENLDLLMDEADIAAQAAVDLDLSQIDPHDFLNLLAKVLVTRYNEIQAHADAGLAVEANALMLDTYRNLSSYALAMGAHIK